MTYVEYVDTGAELLQIAIATHRDKAELAYRGAAAAQMSIGGRGSKAEAKSKRDDGRAHDRIKEKLIVQADIVRHLSAQAMLEWLQGFYNSTYAELHEQGKTPDVFIAQLEQWRWKDTHILPAAENPFKKATA